MLILDIFVKVCVLCSIWTLGLAEEINQMFMIGQRSPFDPSSFSKEIIQCHASCGDDYYSCSIIQCDSNVKHPTAKDDEMHESIQLVENTPSFWSRFLYFFTFGFLGAKSFEDTRTLTYPDEFSPVSGESAHLEQLCMKNCTLVFHKCYQKCICDVNPNINQCNPVIKVFPQTFAPVWKSRFGDVVPDQIKNNGKDYSFDWNNVL